MKLWGADETLILPLPADVDDQEERGGLRSHLDTIGLFSACMLFVVGDRGPLQPELLCISREIISSTSQCAGTKEMQMMGAAICPPNNELHYFFGFIDKRTKFDDEQTNNLGKSFSIRQYRSESTLSLRVIGSIVS